MRMVKTARHELPSNPKNIAVSPSGRFCAVKLDSGGTVCLDAHNEYQPLHLAPEDASHVVFREKTHEIICASDRLLTGQAQIKIRSWPGNILKTIRPSLGDLKSPQWDNAYNRAWMGDGQVADPNASPSALFLCPQERHLILLDLGWWAWDLDRDGRRSKAGFESYFPIMAAEFDRVLAVSHHDAYKGDRRIWLQRSYSLGVEVSEWVLLSLKKGPLFNFERSDDDPDELKRISRFVKRHRYDPAKWAVCSTSSFALSDHPCFEGLYAAPSSWELEVDGNALRLDHPQHGQKTWHAPNDGLRTFWRDPTPRWNPAAMSHLWVAEGDKAMWSVALSDID